MASWTRRTRNEQSRRRNKEWTCLISFANGIAVLSIRSSSATVYSVCPHSIVLLCPLTVVAGFDVIGPANFKPLQFSYWIGVKEALEAMGVEVLVGRVPASAGIEERAKVLAELIEQTFPGREINLIGHSMVSALCDALWSTV